MKRLTPFPLLATLLVAALTLTTGCSDMHEQPSYQAQEAPRKQAAATAVSRRGKELLDWGTPLQNPAEMTDVSRQNGAELYRINCLLCHGGQQDNVGKVGQQLEPPPPDLYQPRIQELSDADLFKRISLGFGRMPPFQKWLTIDQRWDLVNYLRTFGEN